VASGQRISESFDCFVCDLDGVLYRGDAPIEGAAAAVDALRRAGHRFLFLTNNSTATTEQYVAKLGRLGLDVSGDEILTSATVTAEVLIERGYRGKKAFAIGGDGVVDELTRADIEIVPRDREEAVDVVVVGSDPSFDYECMRIAANSVRAGAPLIGTNADPSFPQADGIAPGAGAIIASIEVASGRSAEIMGKPFAPMMEAAARRLTGCTRIAAIGDQPLTDLAGARSQGWGTILVLTGVTAEEDLEELEPAPDHVLGSIAELR
jgi:4-nitrophenyl phosphatase